MKVKNMAKFKYIFVSISAGLAVTIMTGCSSVTDYLGQKMLEKSGVADTGDYVNYINNYQGHLDNNGYYIENDEEIVHEGRKVSFAENNNLIISYYWDSEHQIPIDPKECYLLDGNQIYANVSVSRSVYTNTYEFEGFRFYQFDDEGSYLVDSVVVENTGNDYVITFDDSLHEIKVEPIGYYQSRYITLAEYCKEGDELKDTTGIWYVNNEVYEAGKIEINPFNSYIISYEYDIDEYFFSDSTPHCYYSNTTDGIVIFSQRDADDETLDYTVQLHRYLSVTLVTDINRNVQINYNDNQYVAASNTISIDSLKYGDTIIIFTDKKWDNLKNLKELVWQKEENLYNNDLYRYKYILKVPDDEGGFWFDPNEYKYEHGEIEFTCIGQKVNSPLSLAQGRRIEYSEKSADDGYWLAGNESDHYIVVSDEDTTRAELEKIEFTLKSQVTVYLNQPEAGGSIIYKIDNERLYGSSVVTYSGAQITMSFEPLQGWICNVDNGVTYTVNGNSTSQNVKITGYNIDEVFYEDENHKPELSINLDKSVGDTMNFTVNASGYSIQAEAYGGGWNITDLFGLNPVQHLVFSNTQVLVNKQKIGTEKPIVIEMTNRAIQSGTAIKVVTKKTESDGTEKVSTAYYTDIRDANEPIYIYQPGYEANATVWYKAIDITISVVDIETHREPNALSNTSIYVVTSSNVYLNKDALVEPSETVVVSIRPDDGYYLTGKNLTNDSYVKEMKYSDYVKNINTIISEHSVEKYITITLDESDTFATYTYKRDGANVSGTIKVKKDAIIELTYEITDGTHKLNKSYGGFLGIGASNKKATVSINVSSSYDGKTIKKEDFGLELE